MVTAGGSPIEQDAGVSAGPAAEDRAHVADEQHSHPAGHSHDHGHDHHESDHDHHHASGWWAQLKHAMTPHSHDAVDTIQTAEEARRDGIRTSWIGLAGMLAVAVAQLAIVLASGSIGLLADTVHSLGHAVTTVPLVIAFRLGGRPATKRYPYGYRRAEDVAGIFIVFVIFLTAVYIAYESITGLISPRPLTNLVWVFAAGIVGFLGNEIVAIYRIRGGRRIGSAALIAEGQHARADGFTSLAVAVGITFAWLGLPQADAIVGLLIAVVIFGIMLSSLRSILNRLMDGVDEGVVDRMTAAVSAVPGVRHAVVRARWSGHRMLVEAFVEPDGLTTLDDGVQLTQTVRGAVGRAVRGVDSTTVQLGVPEGVELAR